MAVVHALPYPRQRNDCEMCHERDADVHVLAEACNRPGKHPLLLCQHCLGPHMALRAISESWPGLDRPVAVTITVAPGRRHQPRVPEGGR